MASQWHVGRGGQTTGPYSTEQLRDMAATGRISPGDLVWKEGMAEWADCATVQGLFPATRTAEGGSGATDWNPYRSPTVDTTTASSDDPGSGRLVYADYLPRVGAHLLDMLFLILMTWIPGFLLAIALIAILGQQTASAVVEPVANLLGLLIGIAYYVGLETSTKQGTWGKQIVGIKVTDLHGRRLTAGRALGRYFAHIVTALSFGIGMLMPLFTQKRQTLHDMIAGCLVVNR